MNLIIMACGLMLLPSSRTYYKKYIYCVIQAKSSIHISESAERDNVNFPSIILGLSIACALIHATLSSGKGVSASYDLAISVQSRLSREYINRLLRPEGRLEKFNTESYTRNMNKLIDSNLINFPGNSQQQRLLDSIQSQLHIYYELALIRGANLQATLSAMSERMYIELLNLSTVEAEKSSVKLAGPLTICFLPAFILLSLIPTVMSLAGSLLGGVL